MPSNRQGPTRAEAVERAARALDDVVTKWDWDTHGVTFPMIREAQDALRTALSLPAPARVEGEATRPSAPSSEVKPAALPTRTDKSWVGVNTAAENTSLGFLKDEPNLYEGPAAPVATSTEAAREAFYAAVDRLMEADEGQLMAQSDDALISSTLMKWTHSDEAARLWRAWRNALAATRDSAASGGGGE